ncbi:MAG: hypothetical protein IPK22_15700 [Verrucomicrobiaceae bacterium]|nr:hypothetical protein [Verrucomicrobiaceae bacterium]
MPRTHGTFYFKLTTAGHLLGEYSNPGTPRARPECAFRGDNIPNSDRTSFAGTYISTWFEPGEVPEAVMATLTIAAKSAPADPTTQFTLIWTEGASGSPNVMFRGEAMLNDGILIGHYHSDP